MVSEAAFCMRYEAAVVRQMGRRPAPGWRTSCNHDGCSSELRCLRSASAAAAAPFLIDSSSSCSASHVWAFFGSVLGGGLAAAPEPAQTRMWNTVSLAQGVTAAPALITAVQRTASPAQDAQWHHEAAPPSLTRDGLAGGDEALGGRLAKRSAGLGGACTPDLGAAAHDGHEPRCGAMAPTVYSC